MSANTTNPGASYTPGGQEGAQQDGQSVTIGVGGPTSGEEGASLTHETMAETGGSGGDALTQPRDLEVAPPAPVPAQAGQGRQPGASEAEAAGSAATATARGAQDTRSEQASPGTTGLGTPETGGNQDERDLAPPRKG